MKIFLALYCFVLLNSCCGDCKVTIDTIGQVTEKYRFNIVGIMGEEADTDYVEVWYSEATEDGKNRVVHKWVKPPVIIGGHYSNVAFDEIKASMRNARLCKTNGYRLFRRRFSLYENCKLWR